jgi:DNA (cytosine-5)-methyltransferase 1
VNDLAIQQSNDGSLRELALFAGAGGGILGGLLLGWETVCAVERDAYAAQVLAQRQNDGILKPFPIWSDVTTFDPEPWRGLVDVVSGGFPCQDISAAGKGAGIEGSRSGLWSHMARIIRGVRPRYVFVENSPILTSRGLGVVLGDLASMGFDAEWGVVSAADTGAPHLRERIWIVAHAVRLGPLEPPSFGVGSHYGERTAQACGAEWREVPDATKSGREDVAYAGCLDEQGELTCILDEEDRQEPRTGQTGSRGDGIGRWPPEPDVGRVADGVDSRVDRLKALGNGQVPRVVATAWRLLA